MMQFGHKYLKTIDGLKFYKLLGSGQDGFKPQPDWSVYGLLQVWENEEKAKAFMASSKLIRKYKERCEKFSILYMKSIKAHGQWSKTEPFHKSIELSSDPRAVAIITRASIKTSQLFRFWKYVPETQRAIENAKGLIYTKGMGEFPVWEMATLSIWDTMENAKAYAYSNKAHAKAIAMTRQYNWYKEELFSRFEVYKVDGNWLEFENLRI
jgi:spheroidene monooxygenase